MRAIKRSQGTWPSSRRLPITYDILLAICRLLGAGVFSPFTDLMLSCACQLAFFGFLRCGEFTVRSRTPSATILRMCDVSIAPDGSHYTVILRASKTDPFRLGVKLTIFRQTVVNPVATMASYLQLRQQQGAIACSPLFVESDRLALTRTHFLNYLHQLLVRLGFDVSLYSGHSFRIGAATSAAAAGVEDHLIQTLGRWTSNCYSRYIRTSATSLQRAQDLMCVPPR